MGSPTVGSSPTARTTEAVASRWWLVANYSIDIMCEALKQPFAVVVSESEQKNPW